MIWWLWTAFDPVEVHVFDVVGSDDISWLGECGWTAATDNTGIGLRSGTQFDWSIVVEGGGRSAKGL